MTYSQRARDLVHAILEHPRTNGNNWNAEIWGELYALAEKALAAERCEPNEPLCMLCEADEMWGVV